MRQEPPDRDEVLAIVRQVEASDGDVPAAGRSVHEQPVAQVDADVR
jgi:hypothetical protein